MYLRAVHAEFDTASLQHFIRDNPLGILITAIQSPEFPTIQCTHIPWLLDFEDDSTSTNLGKLRGHLARANPHSKALISAVQKENLSNASLDHEVSVIFNSPVHSYVTPKFYVETKPASGKVVPTWNYAAVQVYGKAKIFCDSRSDETGAFLQDQITDLTKHAEVDIMGYTVGDNLTPWEVSDAPRPYVDVLKKSIIGIEIEIERLEGKYKMSQESSKEDRKGVVDGFESLATDLGCKMAAIVKERGDIKDAKATK